MNEFAEFFQHDATTGEVRFIGDKLEIFIPTRYENKNLLTIGNNVSALAMFDMVINDSIPCGYKLPAVITIEPYETYRDTIDGVSYFVVVLHKGGRFMTTDVVVQDNQIGYQIWLEFLSLGNMPKFVNYGNIATLLDDVKAITGAGASDIHHSMFEIIYAHIYRDPDNLTTHYRHTKKNKPPAQVSLSDVSYGPDSTFAKVFGSYSDDGRNSALLNTDTRTTETLSDVFRK